MKKLYIIICMLSVQSTFIEARWSFMSTAISYLFKKESAVLAEKTCNALLTKSSFLLPDIAPKGVMLTTSEQLWRHKAALDQAAEIKAQEAINAALQEIQEEDLRAAEMERKAFRSYEIDAKYQSIDEDDLAFHNRDASLFARTRALGISDQYTFFAE